MTSLAERFSTQEFVSLQAIAEQHGISQGYLEEIASLLRRQQLIEGKQGPRGGYRLHRPATEISLADITQAIEGELALVDCQKKGALCPVEGSCKTRGVWQGLRATIHTYLHQTRLADILQ